MFRSKSANSEFRINSLSVLVILPVIILGIYAQQNMSALKVSTDNRAHARQTIFELERTISFLKDLEIGQRGFLLTGDATYLKPFSDSRPIISQRFDVLEKRFSAAPTQLDRLKKIKLHYETKIAELDETIRVRKSKGLNAALEIIRAGQGKAEMDEIREIAQTMEAEQLDRIKFYSELAEVILARSTRVVLWGSIVAALLVVFSMLLLRRSAYRRRKIEIQLQELNRDLEKQKTNLSQVVEIQSAMASAGLSTEKIMEIITEQTQKIFSGEGAVIEIIEGDYLIYQAASKSAQHLLGMRVKLQASMSGLAVKQEKIQIAVDTETDPRVDREACRRAKIRSMIVVPLRHQNKVIGVLKIYSSVPNTFQESHIKTLELIMGQLASTLGQASEFEEKQTYIQELKQTQLQLTRAKEEAEEATASKSQFLANMSHEIRTPLNGILGMTGMLLDMKLPSEQQDIAKTIERCGESLLAIINDILDFSKIEAGKLEFEEIEFDITSTLLDIKKTFKYAVDKKGLSFTVDVDPAIPIYVKGDPGRLRQVIMNLIGNAIKFTSTGGITVRASALDKSDTHSILRFEVQDTGIGIEKSAMEKLFQVFTQADASTTRRFGGTGLGLSISKRLVEKMSGQIGVDSQLGAGSTFWFTANFKSGHKLDRDSDDKPDESAINLDQTIRVLVAEDNQINQVITLNMLRKLGYRADVVANGKEVIQALHEHPYDLILMDCQMPEMDGYQATAAIRNSTTLSNPRIPILAMTANAMNGDDVRCINAGMDDYIPKPIAVKKLGVVLQKWVNSVKQKAKTAS
ncbi:CHASE3 domain-containing protein [bacterium]|nr:CHASE3 domain-containing protein [bacterium]